MLVAIGTDVTVAIGANVDVVSVFDAFKLYINGTTNATANNPQTHIPPKTEPMIYLLFDDFVFSSLGHQKFNYS